MALSDLVATIEEEALEVVIDNDVIEGLETHQIEAMQEAVLKINRGNAIYLVGCAKHLHDLRNAIKGSKRNDPRQWSRFKKSGLVPFKPREIQDLVAAWSGWMVHSQLPPEKFNLVGIRTLQKIAAAPAGIQREVEGRLLKGDRVTEKDVKELTGEKIRPSKKGRRKKEMTLFEAKARIKELEIENLKLKGLLKSNKDKVVISIPKNVK